MDAGTLLEKSLMPGIVFREVEPGLYSVYNPKDRINAYDKPGSLLQMTGT